MTENTLFELVLRTPEAERRALLDRVCEDKPELRAKVESLLQANAVSSSPPRVPTIQDATTGFQATATYASIDLMPDIVIGGRYTLEQKLGEGGMGEVWIAKQSEPIKRRVAIKLIKPGMDSKTVIQRFEQERQALALMDHPNIAKVLDGGIDSYPHTPYPAHPGGESRSTGRPYFVMELVNGLPLTKFCDEAKLEIRERLELFVPICQAVQHAHQKGIVHRDLKPGNILVTVIDGKPVPKVIDFGVAKATSGRLTDESVSTQFGAVVGTFEYMSPEQAGFSGEDIDTRADIYSLGVILYELLTGLRPFDSKRLKKAALDEMIRIIREEEPSKPSTRLSTDDALPSLAAIRHIEPSRLTALLRGELDWVVMKCLEKQRERRYESANGLARDIQRYLADEVVEARPPSTGYRLKKFVRRHKGQVIAASLVLLTLLGGIIAFAWQATIARDQRDRAVAAEEQTQKRANELQRVAEYQAQMLQQVDPAEAGAQLMSDLRARHSAALEKSKVPGAERSARTASFGRELQTVNPTDATVTLLDKTVLAPALRTIETQFVNQPLVDASLRTTLGVIYQKLGRPAQALALYQQAYSLRKKILGDEHRETLQVRGGIGNMLGDLQQFVEAESALRDTLTGFQRLLGEDHTDTLDAKALLASQLYHQGKYDDCDALTRDILERRRRVQGPDHVETLKTMGDLGRYLMNRGKYDDAIKVLREVVAAQRRVDEASLTLTLGDLGVALERQKEYTAAEPILREALERRRRERGEDHPSTVTAANNLAALLMRLNKLTEAEPLAKDVVEKCRRMRGNEHAETLKAMNIMGQVLFQQNKYKEAEPYYREALTVGRRVLGEEHPDTIIWIANMGFLMQRLGRIAEAETYFREAVDKNRKQLGEAHPYTFTVLRALVELLRQQNKMDEAEKYAREYLKTIRRLEGDDHQETIAVIGLLGSVLRDAGKLNEAETYFQQYMEANQRRFGAEHANTVTAILRMATLRVAQGKYPEAIALLTPIKDKIQVAIPGTVGVLRYASLLGLLGKAQTGLAKQPADFTPAEANLLEAHSTFAKNRGDRDKETRDWVQGLIELYTAWDKAEPGKGYDAKAALWKKKLEATKVTSTPGKK